MDLFDIIMFLLFFLVRFYCIKFELGYNKIFVEICIDWLLFIFNLFVVELVGYCFGLFVI